MSTVGPSDAEVLRDADAKQGWGEPGYTMYERTTIRPALTINGLLGGYQGPGPKAVIPARAMAKLNFRLVPDQDPYEIEWIFREYVARITPPAVSCVIRPQLFARPVVINRDHPWLRAAAVAYYKGFGSAPVYVRSGGTIPAVNLFEEILGIPTIMMGFALPDDRIHAPNEKFHIPTFWNGITTSIWFLDELRQRIASSQWRESDTPSKIGQAST